MPFSGKIISVNDPVLAAHSGGFLCIPAGKQGERHGALSCSVQVTVRNGQGVGLIWCEKGEALIQVVPEVPVGRWGETAGVLSTALMVSGGSRDRCPHWRPAPRLEHPK